MDKIRLNVLVVLDRSGSMKGSEGDTVNSLNDYFRSLNENNDSDAYVTLTMFDSVGIDVVFNNRSASAAVLNREIYAPRALTPLLDAVGDGIERLENMIAEGELAALVVLTDGHENDSSKFKREDIAQALSAKKRESNWMVLFLGADIDAWADAKDMGIDYDNSLSLNKSKLKELSNVLDEMSRDFVQSRSSVSTKFSSEQRKRLE